MSLFLIVDQENFSIAQECQLCPPVSPDAASVEEILVFEHTVVESLNGATLPVPIRISMGVIH